MTDKQFNDLELRISPRVEDGGYPVTLILDGQREFGPGYLSEDILTCDAQDISATLFDDRRLSDAWAAAKEGRSLRLRLRLHIAPEAPELHALPWESLSLGEHMLSAQANTP